MIRILAVVFDLDDTLIDTTGLLVEPAHREAAAAMVAAGLQARTEDVAEKRIEIARAHPLEEVDPLVAAFFGAEDVAGVARAGHHAYFGRTVRRLDPLPEVLPTLEALADRRLFLLTSGFEQTQRTKLVLTGLAGRFEREVVVPPEGEKIDALARLLAEVGLPAEAVVVVGDRLDREIAAARSLGAWAVRVDRGDSRFAQPRSAVERAHYTVPSVEALPAVLDDIEGGGEPPERP